LPPESAVGRAITGNQPAWSQEDELLASIYDRLSIQVWQAAGKASAPKPKPFPRPVPPEQKRTGLSPDQMRARLHDLRRREEQRGR